MDIGVNQAILITVSILLTTNLIGYIYTALILHTDLINDQRIQPKKYFSRRFYQRLPLILFNLFLLLAVGVIGVYLFYDILDLFFIFHRLDDICRSQGFLDTL